ncbi:MAG TPA: AMP-binding protein [Caldilineaceae bacterium]|nr:AMP-binding protein [Caldilineaceae bacterium]
MAYLVSQLLTQSAQRAPQQIAVVDGNRQLSYQALDELSNQFAHRLLASGVRRGDRVGLYLDKSLEAVSALFGIMKCGAAYVPLDPAAPVPRVAFIVDNCAMKAVVSNAQKMATLQEQLVARGVSPTTILVDDQVVSLPVEPPSDPGTIESDLAYILYTSGSTGNPKGVMISHRAALTFVDWACDTFDVQPEDRVSNHAPFHFDLSTFDLFATIKAGGTVVLVPAMLSVFPRNLADFIAQQEISIWYSVPSALTIA